MEKDELAAEVANLFAERVSEKLASPAESQAKEMIDRLIQDIESEIDDGGSTDSLTPDVSESVTAQERGDDNLYRIQLSDGETVLTEFEETQQASAFIGVVDYLVRNYDLISKLEPLPYIPGRTRPIIHKQTSSGEKEMKQPRELTGGHYVEVNLSSGQKQRELARLVERCGLLVEFDGPW